MILSAKIDDKIDPQSISPRSAVFTGRTHHHHDHASSEAPQLSPPEPTFGAAGLKTLSKAIKGYNLRRVFPQPFFRPNSHHTSASLSHVNEGSENSSCSALNKVATPLTITTQLNHPQYDAGYGTSSSSDFDDIQNGVDCEFGQPLISVVSAVDRNAPRGKNLPLEPQFTLYVHHCPPSWTLVFLLEELGLTYQLVPVGATDLDNSRLQAMTPIVSNESNQLNRKARRYRTHPSQRRSHRHHTEAQQQDTQQDQQCWPEFSDVFPSGKAPGIVDHWNNDFAIGDISAAVEYLVEKYDNVNDESRPRLKPEDFEQNIIAKQWLNFQISEHSSAFTNATYFMYEHPPKMDSVVQHFTESIHRVLTALDKALAKSKSGYLISDSNGPTYADLAFWSWNWVFESGGSTMMAVGGEGGSSPGGDDVDCWANYPHLGAWQGRMGNRDAAAKVKVLWENVQLAYV